MARDGRGRLSSMDMIPDEAQDDIFWALTELNQRKRTQADILFELNDRLAVKGVDPISKSAFNRKAVRIAMHARKTREQRELFAGIADQFTPDAVDEGNIVLGELIKILITDILDSGSNKISSKGAMELARGYRDIVMGQNISADRRTKLEKQFVDKTATAVETVGKKRGLSAETIDTIKNEILGIRRE